jgi:predicted acyltransferase
MTTTTASEPVSATSASGIRAKTARLMSIDALRGFDMFWIVGADDLVEGLRKVSDNGLIQGLAKQLEHVAWAGFHAEDLIFPMFVFIVGVSLVFSLTRTIEEHGKSGAVARILKRSLFLFLLGIFGYGGFSTPFAGIRIMGVLQRIALAYCFAGLIFTFFKPRGQIMWCVGLLLGYWAIMTFVPAPGGVAGNFAEGQNLANWIDKTYLPLRKWDGDHDPEGLLSTFPAIANCLIGVFVGRFLRDSKRGDWSKVYYIAGAGLVLVTLGWVWNIQFPVIKKIWTSSFVLVACGYACLWLAFFHMVVEAMGYRKWCMPFVWIGMNPITIYMLHNLVDIDAIAQRFVGGDLSKNYLGSFGPLCTALAGVAITFGIARFMYKRQIFLRL